MNPRDAPVCYTNSCNDTSYTYLVSVSQQDSGEVWGSDVAQEESGFWQTV